MSVKSAFKRRVQIAHRILREPGVWTRATLAEHYGMSSRQIDKDLAVIRSVYHIRRTHRSYVIDGEVEPD